MKVILFLILSGLCLASVGATIIIRGQTSPLEYQHEAYYLPLNFVIPPGTTNLFITMDGVDKVCFLDKAHPGMFDQISEVSIIINGIKTEWNCFPYKTTVFEVRP
ncbi:hypothetical protein [Legionella fairfieldensis]|uniref:hypothetical protein n=1 Tax=Legionella fairfieldensis TaxID=45064 RepID=UPI00048BF47F|nr:hypothetical protein [Legionella fairfieldensis]